METERMEDLPLLLMHVQRMHLAEVLDTYSDPWASQRMACG